MKLLIEKLTESPDEGLAVKVIRGTSFHCPWHAHPECELVLVLESGGYRLVGDNLTPLKPGDLVLVGANLPHMWQNDEHAAGSNRHVHCLIVQFEESALRPTLLNLPAALPVRRLLQRAAVGIQVTGRTRTRAAALMMQLTTLGGLQRVGIFLQILGLLADSRQCHTIASMGFHPHYSQASERDRRRIDRVCRFIHERLGQPIRLAKAAHAAHLSTAALSRFFRKHLRRTFPEFVNELRIGRACRLLTETDWAITRIASECGYANLSNFNRHFLRLKRTTPRQYRNRLQN